MKKAFTLIELLVVIAIIAILAAILFPVFAQAKDAAKKTQSLSNMKQIATSCLLYGPDYDDYYPMSAYILPPQAPDPRPIVFSVYDAVMPYMKNLNIYVSPADAEKQDWKKRLNTLSLTNVPGPQGVQIASYGPNLGLFGENLCTPILPAAMQKYSPVWSQTMLPDTVGTIMFFDAYILDASFPNPAKGVGLTYNKFMAMARHNEGLVLNFADGHSKFHRWNGVPSGGMTPATGVDRPNVPYYSWSNPFYRTAAQLEAAPNTPANPYNDMHGIPGTQIGDSEDIACS